ncbi:putative siderophore transport system ATP-binding protein YusV [Sporomusa ovata DSM 2662]|uniref:Ferrichrome transport ATP-binding protein FhuC (TC 3.A.1.14.3) n=1 Tax=Sporomusa ovata TaxID=2378 RepID=A0A0U1KZA0_9FIRM|nr:ABC transporter ATP-binding protein [Sporomusa ovata]EQB27818.1 ABC-type cobalamin/Fe3+-siderophores transport system, ATPase component [Sporomusa ovata DSM 2662]CQR72750.1 Ferrichrome transport ATP-binding protein FhuC (TC 3.A.1.14.3) [Sporomusa ovata]
MNCTIEARKLVLGYSGKIISTCLDIVISEPEIVAIIGPNGSGKSTFLKALSRLLPPEAGSVLLNGTDIHQLSPKKVARLLAVLPQSAQAPGDMLVRDLVANGRAPYIGLFGHLSADDQAAVQSAATATGIADLLFRRLDTLSGGERQRVWLAMALAQQPKILMLDEPTTYLDVHHQLEFMKLVNSLHRERKLTVVMVLHDLNHAARFSHRIIAMKKGEIFADGKAGDVLTVPNLRSLYGVEATVVTMEQGGFEHLVCLPHDICSSYGA